MTNFNVAGPYDIPTYRGQRSRIIRAIERKQFFEENPEISERCGCYIFAIRSGNGFTPWYVGKATKRFAQESFGHHKLTHYNHCLADVVSGTPVMFFVVDSRSGNGTNVQHVDEVEKFLIESALRVNPDLLNIKKTKGSQWRIEGIVRGKPGGVSLAAKTVKRMLKLS